jgi:hypothetical protein
MARTAKSRFDVHRIRHRCAALRRGAALRDRDRGQSRCGGAASDFVIIVSASTRRRKRPAGSRRHRRRRALRTDRGHRVDGRAAHHGTARRSPADTGIVLLDMPITRGEPAAEAGQLLVMVGGDTQAFESCKPALESFASSIFHSVIWERARSARW